MLRGFALVGHGVPIMWEILYLGGGGNGGVGVIWGFSGGGGDFLDFDWYGLTLDVCDCVDCVGQVLSC